MEREAPARRSGVLHGRLSGVFWAWALCVCFALSTPVAEGAEYSPPGIGSDEPVPSVASCPEAPAPSESEDPVVAQLVALRADVSASCASARDALGEVRARLWWVTSEVAKLREVGPTAASVVALEVAVQQLEKALTPEAGLPVHLGQVPLPVESAGGSVAVSNPTDLTPVKQAVVDGTETSNQNIWAVFGLLVGFGCLGVVYKLVRP